MSETEIQLEGEDKSRMIMALGNGVALGVSTTKLRYGSKSGANGRGKYALALIACGGEHILRRD